MYLISNICNEISHAFMLIITLFMLIFFIAIYFAAERYKSLLMVVVANAIKLVSIIFMYNTEPMGRQAVQTIVNFLSGVEFTFLIVAVFIILRMEVKLTALILINAANLLQGVMFVIFGAKDEMVHSVNAVIIAILALYCIYKVVREKDFKEKLESVVLVYMLSAYVAFNIVRAALSWTGVIEFGNIYRDGAPYKFMAILRYAFFLLMNFMVVYLNYNYLIRKVRTLSYTDKLTGALNRGFFIKLLEVKVADLKRVRKRLVLAILDIDDFKLVNDTYGHPVGDAVLVGFTKHLKESVRQNDIICRYGGEEFLILMEVENEEEARQAIMRLHEGVRRLKMTDYDISITFSSGMEYISENDSGRSIEEIIKVIDERLYIAKNSGKDCFV